MAQMGKVCFLMLLRGEGGAEPLTRKCPRFRVKGLWLQSVHVVRLHLLAMRFSVYSGRFFEKPVCSSSVSGLRLESASRTENLFRTCQNMEAS